MNMSKEEPGKQKYLSFLSMLYFGLIVFSGMVGYKFVQTPFGIISAASLISPFWFILGDIIAEVYGFKQSMKLFFSAVICELFFSPIASLLINLPSPTGWQNQPAYELIIGSLPKIFVLGIIANLIAWPINSFFITHWKKLTRGKYFFIRSICASGIGLTLFTISSVTLSLINKTDINNIISIVSWSIIIKIVMLCIFSGPASFIVFFLKRNEGIDIYDNQFEIKKTIKNKSSIN